MPRKVPKLFGKSIGEMKEIETEVSPQTIQWLRMLQVETASFIRSNEIRVQRIRSLIMTEHDGVSFEDKLAGMEREGITLLESVEPLRTLINTATEVDTIPSSDVPGVDLVPNEERTRVIVVPE